MPDRNAGRAAGIEDGAASNWLIDEHEAAARLGLTVATLRRWRWAKKGVRWVKLGTAVRYEPSEIRAFIEAGRATPAGAEGAS